jgi:hypothetical protein
MFKFNGKTLLHSPGLSSASDRLGKWKIIVTWVSLPRIPSTSRIAEARAVFVRPFFVWIQQSNPSQRQKIIQAFDK